MSEDFKDALSIGSNEQERELRIESHDGMRRRWEVVYDPSDEHLVYQISYCQ